MPSEDLDHEDTAVNSVPPEDQYGEEQRRRDIDVSTISKWEAFFQGTEYMQKVREVADLYPDIRSISIVYADLDRFDADLGKYLLDHPDLALLAGKQAVKNLMHQEMRRAEINLRTVELPRDSRVEIRELRAKHVGKMVSVEGMVRKATEVRPKITDALFQCLRCGHVIKEQQEGLFFKEPMECYKEQEGCGRSAGTTKFKLLTEESRFVDTQKVEVQESPEGLRGGAQPERLTGYLEDDAAGTVAPGDRIILNGILRSVQKGQPNKSTLFDINLDVISAESQRHEYEEITITPEDEAKIVAEARSPDLFKKVIASISPTIFGYDTEKESLALQLFGGVPKNLDDGTRIRGDIHILLVGDPGVAKSQMLRYMSRLAPRGIYASGKSSSAAGLCVAPDTEIIVNGSPVPIGEFVERRMKAPVEVKPSQWEERIGGQYRVATMSDMCQTQKGVRSIWRIKTPSFLVELVESSGKRLTLTPETKVWARPDGTGEGWRKASDIREGQAVLVRDEGAGVFRWSTVTSASKKDAGLPPYVYDLTVEDSHSFVANGFVVHNTAAAVKDDFGEGRWTLEAGALVLADKGMACIEEDQPVLTDRGFKPIKEVRPGDRVVNFDNGYHVATVKRLIGKGTKETIKLHLYSGDVIECTPDHRLLTAEGWKEAGAILPKDAIKVPADYRRPIVVRKDAVEKGFIHGFALCAVCTNERPVKNGPDLSCASDDEDRARYVLGLLEEHYGIRAVSGTGRKEGAAILRGGELHRSEDACHSFSSAALNKEVASLFHRDSIDLEDRDHCLGLLAGVLSTDRCVSHKQGAHGMKHAIDIGAGRKKHGPGWTEREQRLLTALFQSFGIMAVRRRGKVQVRSLDSYNRAAELIGPLVVGKNRAQLYPAEAMTGTGPCDTWLDGEYVDWLGSVKFDTSRTVELGLRSRINRAVRKRKVTAALMEALRPHWSEITKDPFREPSKDYLLNPVVKIGPGGLRPVYDLTIEGEPNFLLSGGIVHNCIDEMDKMTDQDRSSMHEAMESQCYDDRTEVLTRDGWKFFRDLRKDDLVASLGPDGTLEYAGPTLYVEADYDGHLYRISSDRVDLAITPNHNMYVSVNERAEEFGPFGLCRMDELPSRKRIRLKKNAAWAGEDIGTMELPSAGGCGQGGSVGPVSVQRIKMDDWLEFMGYFLSEDCAALPDHISYRIGGRRFKDPAKMEKIRSCIERLGFRHSYDGRGIDIKDEHLEAHLEPLGRSHHRRVPRELMGLSSRQLKILFDALVLGGGHRDDQSGRMAYGASSRQLADDVQELALKLGTSADIEEACSRGHAAAEGRGVEPRFVVSVMGGNENEPVINSSGHITKVPYRGKIYCVEVPRHLLYVRRNGKPVWCGNTVSVAKAGITATLQCRCSLLGAANPKYGRFEEHQYIADQINMPPALLSRFDLIFALTDKPSAEKDANITAHILKAHRRGQVRKYEDPAALEGVDGEQILGDTANMQPVFDRDFFRKYVAYSKKINPVMNDEAVKLISEYYLKIRKQGEGEGASVPITARQLEAFVRLSEASARARLSRVVEADDAARAIRVVEYYLRKIAGEGDKLDFDIIATGTSHSQREQIGILKKLISQLGKDADPKRGVSSEELYKAAGAEGITEDRAKTLLKRLSQNGEVYSPSNGYYKLASEG